MGLRGTLRAPTYPLKPRGNASTPCLSALRQPVTEPRQSQHANRAALTPSVLGGLSQAPAAEATGGPHGRSGGTRGDHPYIFFNVQAWTTGGLTLLRRGPFAAYACRTNAAVTESAARVACNSGDVCRNTGLTRPMNARRLGSRAPKRCTALVGGPVHRPYGGQSRTIPERAVVADHKDGHSPSLRDPGSKARALSAGDTRLVGGKRDYRHLGGDPARCGGSHPAACWCRPGSLGRGRGRGKETTHEKAAGSKETARDSGKRDSQRSRKRTETLTW